MVLDLETASALIHTEGGSIKESKMRVKITQQTMAQKKVARVGDVLDLPEQEAHLLISLKSAVKVDAKGKPSEPAEISDEDKRDVAVANADAAKANFGPANPKKKK